MDPWPQIKEGWEALDKARLFQNGAAGPVVFAREIGDEPWWRREKSSLVCAFCLTPVVSVRAPVGRGVSRGALFRLAAGREHEGGCQLDPVEVVRTVARGSRGVAVIDGDELHLVLPADLDRIGATDPLLGAGAEDPGGRVGVDVSTVRPLLPPLINSAVVIARFLQKHGDDATVAARFKVRRPGEKRAVGWGEFCYGPAPGEHARLYARLADGSKPAHPVALYGRVAAVGRDRQDRPVLRLTDGHGFTVRIRSEHSSLLAPLAAGVFVLAVGAWKVWTPRKGRPEVQMFAEEHWQLAHWTYDPDTGRSSPPACPPPLSLAQRTLRQTRSPAARKPGPGRVTRLSPKAPRPTGPSATTAAPPAQLPSPPATPATSASPESAPLASPPSPVRPDAVLLPGPTPPAPTAPPLPLPPQPTAPPRPVASPRHRTRRSWWPFGRRR
ncbi:hypothetical protein AB0G74_16505 [Streptomyces sp. NPDC020875]|uniref:hypothetical protein n=1 Tax=Streptomyces sp. NPDC020875 TaxID=3154898 RepID=UPI0033F8C143